MVLQECYVGGRSSGAGRGSTEESWSCVSCGRFASSQLLCSVCRDAYPVDTRKELACAIRVALRWLERKGLFFDEPMIDKQSSVRVVFGDFESAESDDHERKYMRMASTITCKEFRLATRLGERASFDAHVDRIEVRKNIPFWRLCGTLVHELCHAWICLYRTTRGHDDAPPQTLSFDVEEGFCHMITCYFWQELHLFVYGEKRKSSSLAHVFKDHLASKPINASLLRLWTSKIWSHNKYKRFISVLYNDATPLRQLARRIAAHQACV